MAKKVPKGTQPSFPVDMYAEHRRLEFTNNLLAEEARLAKDSLKVALDKLGFDWSPASRDYSIMRSVLAVASLPEVERSLALSEERRVESLQTIIQLRRSVEQLLLDRDEILTALTRQVPTVSYRCVYLGQYAVVIDTELGSACWFIEPKSTDRFQHLEERTAPSRVLTEQERTAALVMLTLASPDLSG